MLEYKARQLTTRERYGGGQKVILNGIDDILCKDKHGGRKGVHQLAANLRRLLSGESVVSGAGASLTLSDCRTILPAIVVYDESLGLEAVRQRADVKLRAALEKLSVDPDRIGPLLVLTIEDMEILDALAKRQTAKDVLTTYAQYVREHLTDRLGSFRSFVANSGYQKNRPEDPTFSERLFRKAWESARADIASRHGEPLEEPGH